MVSATTLSGVAASSVVATGCSARARCTDVSRDFRPDFVRAHRPVESSQKGSGLYVEDMSWRNSSSDLVFFCFFFVFFFFVGLFFFVFFFFFFFLFFFVFLFFFCCFFFCFWFFFFCFFLLSVFFFFLFSRPRGPPASRSSWSAPPSASLSPPAFGGLSPGSVVACEGLGPVPTVLVVAEKVPVPLPCVCLGLYYDSSFHELVVL